MSLTQSLFVDNNIVIVIVASPTHPLAQTFIDFVLSPEENIAGLGNRFLKKHFVEQ